MLNMSPQAQMVIQRKQVVLNYYNFRIIMINHFFLLLMYRYMLQAYVAVFLVLTKIVLVKEINSIFFFVRSNSTFPGCVFCPPTTLHCVWSWKNTKFCGKVDHWFTQKRKLGKNSDDRLSLGRFGGITGNLGGY